ncbi:unnamed protein product [Caenorhabditis nigoni]
METKEYHIGKTVPEMISVIEGHKEYCRQNMKRYDFVQVAHLVVGIADNYDEISEDEKTAKYETINFFLQHLLNPAPLTNFETMPYEELIKRYNHYKEMEASWESYYGEKYADSEKTSAEKPVDRKLFQNMGNRVKAAVNGLFESMKKRIGKRNNF